MNTRLVAGFTIFILLFGIGNNSLSNLAEAKADVAEVKAALEKAKADAAKADDDLQKAEAYGEASPEYTKASNARGKAYVALGKAQVNFALENAKVALEKAKAELAKDNTNDVYVAAVKNAEADLEKAILEKTRYYNYAAEVEAGFQKMEAEAAAAKAQVELQKIRDKEMEARMAAASADRERAEAAEERRLASPEGQAELQIRTEVGIVFTRAYLEELNRGADQVSDENTKNEYKKNLAGVIAITEDNIKKAKAELAQEYEKERRDGTFKKNEEYRKAARMKILMETKTALENPEKSGINTGMIYEHTKIVEYLESTIKKVDETAKVDMLLTWVIPATVVGIAIVIICLAVKKRRVNRRRPYVFS